MARIRFSPCDPCDCCKISEDDFNRGDGDDLGSKWTEVSGDADISSNAVISNSSPALVVTTKTSTNDEQNNNAAQIEVASLGSADKVRLIIDYVDSDNYWCVEVTGDGSGGTAQIIRRESGSDNNEGSSANFTANDFTLCIDRESVNFGSFDAVVISETDSVDLTSGNYKARLFGDKAGFQIDGSGVSVDNFIWQVTNKTNCAGCGCKCPGEPPPGCWIHKGADIADFTVISGSWSNDVSIRNSIYTWDASGSGTNEYYLVSDRGSGEPPFNKPTTLKINGTAATEGTLGSLSAGTWGWGDNDSLGYSTVYVRLSDGTDPDTKSEGYVAYTNNDKILRTSSAGGEVRLNATHPGGVGYCPIPLDASDCGTLYDFAAAYDQHWSFAIRIKLFGDGTQTTPPIDIDHFFRIKYAWLDDNNYRYLEVRAELVDAFPVIPCSWSFTLAAGEVDDGTDTVLSGTNLGGSSVAGPINDCPVTTCASDCDEMMYVYLMHDPHASGVGASHRAYISRASDCFTPALSSSEIEASHLETGGTQVRLENIDGYEVEVHDFDWRQIWEDDRDCVTSAPDISGQEVPNSLCPCNGLLQGDFKLTVPSGTITGSGCTTDGSANLIGELLMESRPTDATSYYPAAVWLVDAPGGGSEPGLPICDDGGGNENWVWQLTFEEVTAGTTWKAVVKLKDVPEGGSFPTWEESFNIENFPCSVDDSFELTNLAHQANTGSCGCWTVDTNKTFELLYVPTA